MKKRFIVAGFAGLFALALSAQIVQPEKKVDQQKEKTESTKEAPPVPPLPPQPPPPPPPVEPPLPPLPPDEVMIQDDLADFLKRNPAVKGVSWNKNEEIIIYKKDGGKEIYSLQDKKSLEEAETKYGLLPATPPPPPPLPPPPPVKKTKS